MDSFIHFSTSLPVCISHDSSPFLCSLSPSAGCYWISWSSCLRSLRQLPRRTAWCCPTCSRLPRRVKGEPRKTKSSFMSRLTYLPKSRQCCRLVSCNTDAKKKNYSGCCEFMKVEHEQQCCETCERCLFITCRDKKYCNYEKGY